MADPASPADDEAFLARLAALAPKIEPGAGRVEAAQRLSAGASQELWRFDLVGPGVRRTAVLRRAPGGDRVSAHAAGPENEAHLIMAAEAAGVPVPKVLYVLEPGDGAGRGFVMSCVEGETLGGRIVRSPELADARKILARQCGEILARIHAIDPAGFPGLARQTPRDLVDQWEAAYRTSERPRPVFDLAFRWLRDRMPDPKGGMRLVHGDFRNGNLMIGADGVRAVLDWELAHVGDPMEDFGWVCTNSWRFGSEALPVGGFGRREDLFAGYEAAGGAPVDRDAARWWEIYGSLRWGVMCAGMPAAFRTVDPGVERAVIARRASETEIDLMRLLDV